jgi:8-oxo-dGTP pyrophosphatase MutT (NUDIX family)
VILQKQYRPPVEKVTIEVPAGLIDAGETAEQAAVRELKEETGYVGVATESSTIMFNGQFTQLSFTSPGCSESIRRPYLIFFSTRPRIL